MRVRKRGHDGDINHAESKTNATRRGRIPLAVVCGYELETHGGHRTQREGERQTASPTTRGGANYHRNFSTVAAAAAAAVMLPFTWQQMVRAQLLYTQYAVHWHHRVSIPTSGWARRSRQLDEKKMLPESGKGSCCARTAGGTSVRIRRPAIKVS